MTTINWKEAFRHDYKDALPEAKKLKIDSPAKCAEAIAFKETANHLAKELIAEMDTMIDELRETAQILERKIDDYRKPVLVKPKKPTKQEIGDFEI